MRALLLRLVRVTTHSAEDRRARHSIHGQVLEAGRQAQLEATYAVGEFVAKLKAFNSAMSGNTGDGEDDAASAHAFAEFTEAFDGFDSLTRSALTVETLGAVDVSDRIRAIREESLQYVMSLEPPIFRGQHANKFEERADSMMEDVVSAIRRDLGTDAVRAAYVSRSPKKPPRRKRRTVANS